MTESTFVTTGAAPRTPRVIVALAFALVWIALLSFPEPAVGRNLDLDWGLALGHFMATRAQAGVDYSYTYGPLGYLFVWPYFPGLFGIRFVWGIAFAGASALVLVRFATLLPSRALQLAWLWLSLSILPGAQVLYLVVPVVVALLHVLEDEWSTWRLALSTALLATIGLVKFTFLVVAVGLVMTLSLAPSRGHRLRKSATLIALFLSWLCVGWWSAGQSLRFFPRYLVTCLEIARGYSDAMSVDESRSNLSAAFEALGLVCVGTLLLPSSVWISRRGAGVAMVALGLFTAWKEGVVRADPGHLVVFLGYAALSTVMLSALPDGRDSELRLLRSSFFAVATFTCLGALRAMYADTPLRWVALARTRDVSAHSLDIVVNPRAHREHCDALWRAQEAQFSLPAVAARIGRNTMDTVTLDQSVVLYNRFNWKPRPAFQSFVAYAPELARSNGEFFRRADAPRYVLFRWGSIDRRFPAGDDPTALIEILRRYRPVLRERDYILMERRPPTEIHEAPVLESIRRHLRFGAWLREDFDKRSFYTLSVTAHPTLFGRLKKFFFRGPRLIFSVQQAAGERKRYELVPELASTPFALSPLFEGNFDVGYYYSGSGRWITRIGFARKDDVVEFFGDGVDVQIDRYPAIAEPNTNSL